MKKPLFMNKMRLSFLFFIVFLFPSSLPLLNEIALFGGCLKVGCK